MNTTKFRVFDFGANLVLAYDSKYYKSLDKISNIIETLPKPNKDNFKDWNNDFKVKKDFLEKIANELNCGLYTEIAAKELINDYKYLVLNQQGAQNG